MAARFRLPKSQKRQHFIKEWRKYRGKTLEKVAEEIGITKGSLSLIENMHSDYSQSLLEILSVILCTDPASLIMRDPFESEPIWSVWNQAQPEQRAQIVELARVIVGKHIIKTGTE